MNVTKDGFKNKQLHNEEYLQMVSAEQKEHAEVFAYQRITENNNIFTDFQTDNLMEQILHRDNLTATTTPVQMLMCHKVTHKNLIDSSLPFRTPKAPFWICILLHWR